MHRSSLLVFLISFCLVLKSEVIIDVRTPEEFQNAHIINSKNIEWQNISDIVGITSKDEKIYLYCRSGNRSGKATKILIDLGYKDVTNLGSIQSASEKLGKEIASRALKKGIKEVVFDRGGFLYHGKIKALADAARENGLKL